MGDAILLTNLGSPDQPSPPAARRYLAEFLGDWRVVDLPRLLWLPILYGIVLNVRPKKTAAKYARIWTPEGSPLKIHTERQARLLEDHLAARGRSDIRVDWAMRYGNPPIPAALDRLAATGARRILVLPMYPQYTGSTTGSVEDAVAAWCKRQTNAPEIRWVREYSTDPGYIGALAASLREHWERRGRAEKLVMSFHGIPQRAVERGDPYAEQCHATANALAAALALPDDAWLTTFQSRFGAAKWLQPYTQPTLERLARQGIHSVDVICPGFPADCLETLEEIAMEYRAAFLEHGGRDYRYIPCLNERDDWICALTELALTALPAFTCCNGAA